jgi:hypothetical protein
MKLLDGSHPSRPRPARARGGSPTFIRAVLIGCVLALAAVAHAQKAPSEEFTQAFQAGADAYRLGRLDEARAHLERAKSIDPTLPGPWRFLAQVAAAEEKWDECVASSREAIRLNPTSSTIAETRQVHDQCRKAWGKPDFPGPYETGTGAISVTADQAGASVEINSLAYGATPMAPRAYPAGQTPVVVTVKKAGYLDATREVIVLPEIVTDVDVVLEVDPNAAVIDPGIGTTEVKTGWIRVTTGVPGAVVTIDGAPPKLDDQGRAELESGVHEVVVTADGYEPQRRSVRVTKGQVQEVKVDLRSQARVDSMRSRGTILMSSGLALAVAGAVTGVLSLRAGDEARDIQGIEQTRPPFGTLPEADSAAIQPIRTRADQEAAEDRAKKWALISNISYGAAVVAIGVGAYYLVKSRKPADEVEPHKISIVPVPVVDEGGGLGAAAVGEVRW